MTHQSNILTFHFQNRLLIPQSRLLTPMSMLLNPESSLLTSESILFTPWSGLLIIQNSDQSTDLSEHSATSLKAIY